MSRVAISGFASLDHVIVLDGAVTPGRTTTILSRPREAWPRLGGGPAYVAQALVVGTQITASPISWVGDDPEGASYAARLQQAGVDASGLSAVAGGRTPASVMAYDASGDCAVLYHPGIPGDIRLSDNQRALIQRADWLCVTIGPLPATTALLDLLRDDQRLAWIVKNDPRVMTDALRARLAARADVIFCNGSERGLLPAATPRQIVIETRGATGAHFQRGDEGLLVPTTPIAVTDPTGAGDTFAGGVLSALVQGETDLHVLGEAGHRAARRLLAHRQSEDPTGRPHG
jgi:ribokinase